MPLSTKNDMTIQIFVCAKYEIIIVITIIIIIIIIILIIVTAILGLQKYIQESEEKLITAARKPEDIVETAKGFKSRRAKERKQDWTDKALHGQFLRQTEAVASKDTWEWLSKGGIKRETETLILAAQEQAIRTNQIKAKIDKTQEDSLCRMCKQADETVNHLLSECSKMAQKEFKRRHDWVGKKIHWEACLKYGFDVKSVVFWDLCRLHADWKLHVSNRTKLHSHTALQIIMNQYTESLASLLVCAPSQLKHNITFSLQKKT